MMAHCIIYGIMFILFSTDIGKSDAQHNKCPKPNSATELDCCVNYKEVNGKCIECDPGFYGTNCNTKCPEGYYGKLCVKKCNCSFEQRCLAADGCREINFKIDTSADGNASRYSHDTLQRNEGKNARNNMVFSLPIIICIIVLSLSLTFIVILYIIRNNMKARKLANRLSRLSGFLVRHHVRRESPGMESRVSNLCPNEESVYSDIRVSQMLPPDKLQGACAYSCETNQKSTSDTLDSHQNEYSKFKERKSNLYDKISFREKMRGRIMLTQSYITGKEVTHSATSNMEYSTTKCINNDVKNSPSSRKGEVGQTPRDNNASCGTNLKQVYSKIENDGLPTALSNYYLLEKDP